MALLKPIVEYNNPPYTRSFHGTLRKDDRLKADVIQRDPNPLNKTFLGYNGILSMPETLTLGQGSFLYEGIEYEYKKMYPCLDIPFLTFSRYSVEHLKQIHHYYNVTIKVNYFVLFDQSDEPGPVFCRIYPSGGKTVELKVKLNNPPSHLKPADYNIEQHDKVVLEKDRFSYNGKTYKKYPTHSDIIMIDTNYSFDENTLAYMLSCVIRSRINIDKDLHPSLYYQYEIIAHKYRDY